MGVEGLLANPNIRKFVDRVAKKDTDVTATTARKQRQDCCVATAFGAGLNIGELIELTAMWPSRHRE